MKDAELIIFNIDRLIHVHTIYSLYSFEDVFNSKALLDMFARCCSCKVIRIAKYDFYRVINILGKSRF